MSFVLTEITRTVWNTEAGISVGPDQDGFGCVRVYTQDDASKEYYGEIDFTVDTDVAKAFGEALIAAANEIALENAKEMK